MTKLIVKDWKQDVIYLVQFPRAGCVPSISMYSLKLETWLRMAGLDYQNVSNQFKYTSSRGQVPFVEVNGRHIPDSNTVIEEVTRMFNVKIDKHLSDREKADLVAYHSLIEDALTWVVFYFRSKDNAFIYSEQGWTKHFNGIKRLLLKMFTKKLQRLLKRNTFCQGIGRQPVHDVVEGAKTKLKALSNILGNKKYLLGNRVTTLDATAFGHLCQIYYVPLKKEIKDYMDSDCKNLVDYLDNIKREFWPDWEECTSKLSLDTAYYKRK